MVFVYIVVCLYMCISVRAWFVDTLWPGIWVGNLLCLYMIVVGFFGIKHFTEMFEAHV